MERIEDSEEYLVGKDSRKKLRVYLCIQAIIIVLLVVALIIFVILYANKDCDEINPTITPAPIADCLHRPTAGPQPRPPTGSGGPYKQAAVAADDIRCSKIGKDVLEEKGSAVDAAVATLFCLGVINLHSTGIGGGGLMVVYSKQNNTAQYFNFREKAPAKATQDMFVNKTNNSSIGGLSIAVPGEVKGMYEAWKMYGKLKWKRLVEPAIKIAKEGFIVQRALAEAINISANIIRESEGLMELFVRKDRCLKRIGDMLVNQKLAITLERVSCDPMSFYEGDLAQDIVKDIAFHKGIVTAEDLKNYTVQIMPAINASLNDNMLFTADLPSSGIVLTFMLNVLKGYNFTSKDISNDDIKATTYHRIIETFKYAYARRALLGDKDFLPNITKIYNELLNESYAENIRLSIQDNRTFNDPKHYSGFYANHDVAGTSHVSILASNGDAVSVTSTINTYFGSKVRSTITGIIYNDQMDDFSTPGLVNDYGLEPSPSNFIRPGKRPMSSMSPVIITDKTSGDVVFIAGASGGSRITTGTALVVINKLWLGLNTSEAVDAPRFHNQLSPNETAYEKPPFTFPQNIRDILSGFGHNMIEEEFYCVVQAVSKGKNGDIYAKSDPRKGGYPAGF